MLDSFIAFNINGISNFIYMITSNLWFLLLLVGVVEPDTKVCDKITDYSNGLCLVPGLSFDLYGYRLEVISSRND